MPISSPSRAENPIVVATLRRPEGAQARAVAEMGDHHPPGGEAGIVVREHGGDVGIGQAVESVALHARSRISRGSANICASAGWVRWKAVSKQAT